MIAPLHIQLDRLQVALSDPEGWSLDVEAYTLVHHTGLFLQVEQTSTSDSTSLFLHHLLPNPLWSHAERALQISMTPARLCV